MYIITQGVVMNKLKTFFKGILIGSSMSIPGISGGTVAIMLGEYDRLLESAADLLKKPRQNLPFLLMMAAGGAAGLLTAARLLTLIFATAAEVPLKFAFLGLAAGCVPAAARQCGVLPITPRKLLLTVVGGAAAAVLTYLPQSTGNPQGVLPQLLCGLLLAAALVLPGISASQTLLMLGMYQPVMARLSQGDFLPLAPMALGMLVGIFISAKLLSWLLRRFSGTYLVIMGFMLFSLTQLIPSPKSAAELAIGLVCCACGCAISALINSHAENHDIS